MYIANYVIKIIIVLYRFCKQYISVLLGLSITSKSFC